MSSPDLFAAEVLTQEQRQYDLDHPDTFEGANALQRIEEIGQPFAPPAPVASGGNEMLSMMMGMIGKLPKRDAGQLKKSARRVGEAMADRALYAFPVGGKRIEGPTVHLIEALAGEYGSLWTGTEITSIQGDRVFIRGVVLDLVTCTCYARPYLFTLPPAPGKFAEKADQANRWETMQVQNALSKAVRTALEHSLPRWYIEEAIAAARTIIRNEQLKGLSVEEAGEQAVKHFSGLGVEMVDLEDWLGAQRPLWTASDIIDLRKLGSRIKNNETTVAAEFEKHRAKRKSATADSGVGLAAIKNGKTKDTK